MKKRLLILTADAGFGHRSASNAVAQAYTILHGEDGEVFITNPVLDSDAPWFIRKSQKDYDQNVVRNPAFYTFTYKISDTPPASMMISGAMSVLLKKAMRNAIDRFQPDCILSTFHFYQAALGPILQTKRKKIPLFSVVTDLADVHQLWFECSPDILFVPTENVRDQALASGFPQEKVLLSGMPVNPSIALEKRSKCALRAFLGWDADLPVLLVVGSRRVNRTHLVSLLQSIDRDFQGREPCQVVVVAGGDPLLYQALSQEDWHLPVCLYEYVENMAAFLRAADLLVSKAGGMITSEALACGLPIVLIENLPGQEEGNIHFLCGEEAAVSAIHPEQLKAVISSLLENDQTKLRILAANARRIGRPEAAFTIAETIWQSTGSNPNFPGKIYPGISRRAINGRRSTGITQSS